MSADLIVQDPDLQRAAAYIARYLERTGVTGTTVKFAYSSAPSEGGVMERREGVILVETERVR